MQANVGKPQIIPVKRLSFSTRVGLGTGVAYAVSIALALCVVALALTLALRTPPALMIDVGGPADTRFINGVLPPQRDPVTGLMFRWTKPTAQLRLHGSEFASVELALRMHNSQSAQAGARQLRLKYGDQLLSAPILTPGWRTYYVLLPETPSDAHLQAAGLTLESDPLLVGATDSVQRGVAIDWVRVQPLHSIAPPWRALALTCGLALIAGWLWVADSLLFKRAGRLRWLRVGALVGVLAVALVWWAATDPYTLAWALPTLPWSFGSAAIVLLAVWLGGIMKPRQPSVWIMAAAIGALIAGQALLNAQSAIEIGGLLALLGLALLLACDGWADTNPVRSAETQMPQIDARFAQTAPALGSRFSVRPKRAPGSRFAEPIALVCIFLLALGLRLYHIAELPYGLWQDEARHGLEALHILNDPSYRPVYIGGHVDLPGFGMYPFVLAMKLWGAHIWSMRIVTGLAGALTIFPLYGLVRRLFGRGPVALLAVALLAVSSWQVIISRFSFPTIFDPLLQMTGLWLLTVGLADSGRKGVQGLALLLAGVCIGLAMQTYHTGRLAPLMAGVRALFLLARAPQRWRWWLAGGSIALIGLAISTSAIVGYALNNPDIFNQRVGAVSLLGREDSQYSNQAPLAVLDNAVGKHALMFNVHGDDNGRQNEPGRPMLDFVTGLGFLVGMAACLRRWRDWRSQFLLIALAIGLLPSVLSVDSPHAMRSIDALPYVCIIAALGLLQIGRLCAAAQAARPMPKALRFGIGTLVVGLALAWNCWTYFISMPSNPAVWTSFYPVHTQVGTFVQELAEQRGTRNLHEVFIQRRIATNPVFSYLADGLSVQTIDGTNVSGPATAGALFIVSSYSASNETDALVAAMNLEPTPLLFGPKLPDGVRPSFIVYRKK